MITPGNSLYFPAVDFIKTSVGKAGVNAKNLPVVIDCRFILGKLISKIDHDLNVFDEF
jgi:sodium-independent sulfate anion transporter 11